ncbi:MAG: response regulator [Pseudomonadales bacterium]|nr:response regulator [Pseudomonadales bacterium]
MSRILVVDDSASIRQLASFTLQNSGFDTVEADDGKDAVNKASSEQFDLILTDRNMPNMDGIQLTKELRGNDDYKFVPILMLTTESEKDKKIEGKEAGVTGWIVKPFNPDTLISVIKKVLN